jgi:hypothetical protein
MGRQTDGGIQPGADPQPLPDQRVDWAGLMAPLGPVDDFESSCAAVARRWAGVRFRVSPSGESASQRFGRVVSPSGMEEAYQHALRMDRPWVRLVVGGVGMALAVFGLLNGAGPVGLAVIVAFAGVALSYRGAKRRDDAFRSDVDLARRVFPEFQRDLDRLLGRATYLARDADRAHACGEITDDQRRRALEDLHDIVATFAQEQMELTPEVLARREFPIASSLNDLTVVAEVDGTLREIVRRLRPDTGIS